jgi:sulfate transporter 4
MQNLADLQIHQRTLAPIDEVPVATEDRWKIHVPHMPGEKADQILDRFRRREKRRSFAYKTARKVKCGITGEKPDPDMDTPSGFQQYFTIFEWVQKLSASVIQSDMIAGITVGVMAVPQSMSYANIAGLQFVYGLYSAATPTFVYALMGTSRQLAVGPVAMVSLLLEAGLRGLLDEEQCPAYFENNPEGLSQNELCPDEYAKLAFLTCLVSGGIQVIAAILNLGFLVSFLGHPVVSGFTSAAAIIIGLSQLQYVLGFPILKSQFIYVTVYEVIINLHKTNPVAVALGVSWIVSLIFMRKASKKDKRLALLGPMAPLLMCTIGTILVRQVPALSDEYGIKYVGELQDGFPGFSWPLINFQDFHKVLPTALSVSLIGYMESVAIGKSLAAANGYEIDPGQEMMALGVTNIIGSGLSCYPTTGSFSRSAVNNQVGAQTQLSGMVTSGLLFLTLIALTELFYYLPKFALAAIVISSVIPLVAISEGRKLYNVSKKDGFLWLFSFFGTLFLGVLMGISLSVFVSLALLIHESVNPQIVLLWRLPGTEIYRNVKQESIGEFVPGVMCVRVGAAMYFANAALVKDRLLQYVLDMSSFEPVQYVVIEMTPVSSIDSTAMHMIEDMVKDFRNRNIFVAVTSLTSRVQKTMGKAQFDKHLGKEWIFDRVHDAVLKCLHHKRMSSAIEDGSSPSRFNVTLEEDKDANRNETDDHTFVVSNMVDPKCTVVEVHMRKAWPTLMSDLLAIFVSSDAFISKSESESSGPFLATTARFWMTSTSMGSKLSREQMEHIQTRVVSMCRSRAPDEDLSLLRPAGRSRASWLEDRPDLNGESEETRSVSNASMQGGNAQRTPSKLNNMAGMQSGMQSFEGMEQVPQGAFIIPAGAVVMMPAGSQVQYVNNRGGSEPERERTPETGEGRFAL